MKRIIILLLLLTACIREVPIKLVVEGDVKPQTPTTLETETPTTTLQNSTIESEQKIVRALEGKVHLPKNTTKTLSKWYNTSIDKRSVEWGVCFYGQSYEVSQNFTGYFPTTMIEARTKNAEVKEVILTCDLNYGGESFIGTAHIHHNNNILPSFQDTTTWAHLPGRERKFHCVFLDDMKINCYSWKGYPILMN